MFPPMVDGETEFLLKPMNCPSHMILFNAEPHSYRDLPLRYAEFATLYRYEKSGELNGLTRVRSLTQDDAHIFCTPDQIQQEFELAPLARAGSARDLRPQRLPRGIVATGHGRQRQIRGRARAVGGRR